MPGLSIIIATAIAGSVVIVGIIIKWIARKRKKRVPHGNWLCYTVCTTTTLNIVKRFRMNIATLVKYFSSDY